MSHLRIVELMEVPQHLEELATWLHGEWERTHPHEKLSEADTRKSIKERETSLRQHICVAPLPTTFVALQGARPIGACSLVYYRIYNTDKPSIWLTNLFVLPEYRSRGVASDLLGVAESFAQIHGVKRLKIFTYDAADFYRNKGWNFLKRKALQGVSVDILEKPLA